MNPRRFLDLAGDWASGSDEGEWRSASGRAYYAAFHIARRVLLQVGFQVPVSENAHAYLWLRFSNCDHPLVSRVGDWLRDLRTSRNRADYDLDRPFQERVAVNDYNLTLDCIEILENLSRSPELLARVGEAIRNYERDVLREITFSP